MSSIRGTSRPWRAATVGATLLISLLTACGGAAPTPASSASKIASSDLAERDDATAAMVPREVAQTGTLRVGVFVYPPAVIQDPGSGELSGWEIDNIRNVAAVLGLEPDITVLSLDGLIPALQANRFDVGAGELGIIGKRTDVVSIVKDHQESTSFIVRQEDRDLPISGPRDLCGMSAATTSGASFVADVEEWNHTCAAEGLPSIELQVFQEDAAVVLAVREGRARIAPVTTSRAVYTESQSNGELARIPGEWGHALGTGIAIAPTPYREQMAQAVHAAVTALIRNGKLQEALDRYNNGLGGISETRIYCCGEEDRRIGLAGWS